AVAEPGAPPRDAGGAGDLARCQAEAPGQFARERPVEVGVPRQGLVPESLSGFVVRYRESHLDGGEGPVVERPRRAGGEDEAGVGAVEDRLAGPLVQRVEVAEVEDGA